MNQGHSLHFYQACVVTVMLLSGYYLLLPALPLYMLSLSWSTAAIGVIIGLFSLSSLLIRPLSGTLIDRFGANWVVFGGAICYLIAVCFTLVATSYWSMGITQLFLGLAIGSFTVALSTFVIELIPQEQMATLLGWYSIAIVLAKGLAPAVGLALYDRLSFGPLIWIALFSVALGLFISLRLPGFLPKRSLSSAVPVVEVAAGTIGKSAPVVTRKVGTSTKERWLPFAVGPSLSLLGIAFVFGAFNVIIPVFSEQIGVAQASLFFVVETASVVLVRLTLGLLLRWLSRTVLMFLSFIGVLVSLALLMWTASLAALLLVAFVFGLGYGVGFPVLNEMVAKNVSQHVRGRAIGLFTTSFDLGFMLGSLSLALLEWLTYPQLFLSMSTIVLFSAVCFIVYYGWSLQIRTQSRAER